MLLQFLRSASKPERYKGSSQNRGSEWPSKKARVQTMVEIRYLISTMVQTAKLMAKK
jgi:hypothetical protein